MKRLLLLLLLAAPLLTAAQAITWADTVIGHSSFNPSGRFPGQFTAANVLGPPNKIPGVLNPAAWQSDPGHNAGEFIHVGFKTPLEASQIGIVESMNPGSINKITLFDEAGAPHVVYENLTPGPLAMTGRVFCKFFPLTTYKVAGARVDLKRQVMNDPAMIDAIGITNSADSIKVTINVNAAAATAAKPENLGANINSPTEELCPVISPDGKTLYFTRQNHPDNFAPIENQDIWMAEIKADGSFNPAQNLGAPLSNNENNSICAITPDGQTALLLNVYLPDGRADNGISTSQRDSSGWAFPKKVVVTDYYNDNVYGEYCLSASGKVLMLTLQRKDSKGGKDIHVSFLNDNGTWTAPANIGGVINTAESETSPFLAADEKTLYFSSAGWPGYGKNDMFVTRRLDDTWMNWSPPENLGPVLNTPGWDAYYSIPASGEFAYFVSYSNSLGASDIFRTPLPKELRPAPVVLIRGTVRNKKTNEPMGATIKYENLGTGENLGIAHSDPATGAFTIVLPAGENYGFLPEKKKFIGLSDNIDLSQLTEYKEIVRDLFLVPIEKGQVVKLNNIFFDTGKFDLRSESRAELDRLVKVLKSNPVMEIEIDGHTDNVGDDAANLTLSRNRAKAVMDYLLAKGIAPLRLKSQGYGETKPVDVNTTPEGRQNNRRVEFLILKSE